MIARAMTRRAALATLLWASLPAAVAAQGQLQPGDQIRLLQSDGLEVRGTLAEVSEGSIRLFTAPSRDYTVPHEQIEMLERRVGQERRFGNNFLITMMASAGVGGVLGAVTWSPCTETGFLACLLHPESRGEAFTWGLAAGGLVGVPIGIIVGIAKKHDVWEPISVSGTRGVALELTPVVGPDRVGFTASIPWRGP